MKKQKRGGLNNIKKIILLVVFVSVIGIVLYNFGRENNNNEIMVVSSIDDYNYVLDSNETRVYKKYFKELEDILASSEIDEEEYAKLVTKLFVIDFYTLTNKVTNQDVGGLQFINSSIKDNFYSKAVNTIYKYVKSNLYGTRHQNLPEVKDVEIASVKVIKFAEGNIKDNLGYEVVSNISYKKDLGYPENIIVRLVHEESKITVVEVTNK